MSCCGKTRGMAGNGISGQNNQQTPIPGLIAFEYIGRTALTVIGPASRTTYRFEEPGARVVVDARDRPSLNALPMLKQC
ncbi:MAG: hypothetical protein ABSH24_35850 [Bryobacteraceae bacterium]|jgi:hypothetical protein